LRIWKDRELRKNLRGDGEREFSRGISVASLLGILGRRVDGGVGLVYVGLRPFVTFEDFCDFHFKIINDQKKSRCTFMVTKKFVFTVPST